MKKDKGRTIETKNVKKLLIFCKKYFTCPECDERLEDCDCEDSKKIKEKIYKN